MWDAAEHRHLTAVSIPCEKLANPSRKFVNSFSQKMLSLWGKMGNVMDCVAYYFSKATFYMILVKMKKNIARVLNQLEFSREGK